MASFSTLLLAVIAICFQPVVDSFVSPRKTVFRPANSVHTKKCSSTTLFYTNGSSQPMQQRVLTIPVLGPIPGAKPLVVGEDYKLSQPTEMQFQIMEEALHIHQSFMKQEPGAVGIEAAPLVAFMDDVTSTSTLPGDKKNSKYATIAAVVGISSGAKGRDSLDTSSNDRFMESMMRVFQPDSTMIDPSETTIRLVGIGRAALSDFHSRLPSSYYERVDHGEIQEGETETPLLMAQFRLLSDTSVRSDGFINHFGRSANASPMHALAEMSSLSNRITSLHEDRKQLVRGLRAAKARLAVASQASVLEDHDGLGQLSSGFEIAPGLTARENAQNDIDTLLNNFPANSPDNMHSLHRNTGSHAKLLEMENYGMGISSASFSAIPSLTKALEEKLQPYYSPELRETEEHYYEVFSFLGVLSLAKFVTPQDLGWALKCTNTIERMQWVYEWMWSHKQMLREASEEVSQELRDCGEECTDLW